MVFQSFQKDICGPFKTTQSAIILSLQEILEKVKFFIMGNEEILQGVMNDWAVFLRCFF
jgi:hypothetical protein